jgi:hypothetical protein
VTAFPEKQAGEAGKGLGHIAASVNIYFRKSEYDNKIKELETWIVKNI